MSSTKVSLSYQITFRSRHLPDGTWVVSRFIALYGSNGLLSSCEDKSKADYICKSKSAATRKLNQLIKNEKSCEFFIEEFVLDEAGQVTFEEVKRESVFNTLDTLRIPLLEEEVEGIDVSACVEQAEESGAVAIGNSEADGCNSTADTPPSNTGGLSQTDTEETSADFDYLGTLKVSETYTHNLVMENGKVREILLRRGYDTPAFIDTLSLVFDESIAKFYLDENVEFLYGRPLIDAILVDIRRIMGFGKSDIKINGRNGYENAIQLGRENRNYGYIAWGGVNQKGSVMLHFTGEGLANAENNWEVNLYRFLDEFDGRVKISRIDLSHDFLNGEYTVEQALQDWQNDFYTVSFTRPQGERNGSDWDSNNGKGRSFYIGSKKSSRLLIFYEKGKQLGDVNSNWLRGEMRIRSKDYVIPLEALIYPGDFYCNAYPHLLSVLDYHSTQDRFNRNRKHNLIGLQHAIKYARMQVSPVIKVLKGMQYTDEEIIGKIYDPKCKPPKRLISFDEL